jgi:16S rRNA (uracil1498-N3)-methyltransferase
MAKIRIYQPQQFCIDEDIILNKRNTHYLKKVLRIQHNAIITLFNGDGYNYTSIITRIDTQITAKITNKQGNNCESDLDITLVQAIAKGDKMDFIIQKATELGVRKIIPIITQRTIYKPSNKDSKKITRWQEVAINSCEQCGRSVVPVVEDIISFSDLQLTGESFILDTTSCNLLKTYQKPIKPINIMIGPEGGFSEEELDNQYHKLSLGKRILRTETAGIAAIAGMLALWDC